MDTETTTTSPRPLFGGLPTKEHTDALMAMIEGREEGQIAAWDEIEKTMGTTRRTQRGGSILAAWKRRAFRERNLLLVSAKGVGYRLADPAERVMVGSSLATQGKRRIMRAATVAGTTDAARLNEEQRKTREHLMQIPAKLRLAELTAPKRVLSLTE